MEGTIMVGQDTGKYKGRKIKMLTVRMDEQAHHA